MRNVLLFFFFILIQCFTICLYPMTHQTIHEAIDGNNEVAVRQFLEYSRDLNDSGSPQRTPLYCAALGGYASIVKILLEAGSDPDALGDSDHSPLHIAAHNVNPETTLLLIDAGAEIDIRGWCDMTPLHVAVRRDSKHVAQALCQAGANVNAVDKRGATPLDQAISKNYHECVFILLSYGAQSNPVVHTSIYSGHSLFSYACTRQFFEIAHHLLCAGYEFEQEYRRPLSDYYTSLKYSLVARMFDTSKTLFFEQLAAYELLPMDYHVHELHEALMIAYGQNFDDYAHAIEHLIISKGTLSQEILITALKLAIIRKNHSHVLHLLKLTSLKNTPLTDSVLRSLLNLAIDHDEHYVIDQILPTLAQNPKSLIQALAQGRFLLANLLLNAGCTTNEAESYIETVLENPYKLAHYSVNRIMRLRDLLGQWSARRECLSLNKTYFSLLPREIHTYYLYPLTASPIPEGQEPSEDYSDYISQNTDQKSVLTFHTLRKIAKVGLQSITHNLGILWNLLHSS